MKEILKLIGDASSKVEDLMGTREEYYYDRSEKWQDSDKAIEYEAKTDILNEVLAGLELASDAIDEFTKF